MTDADIQLPEPPAYWWRHINEDGEPTTDWHPVEPRNPYVNTVADSVRELRAYEYKGKPCYEVMPVYTEAQLIEHTRAAVRAALAAAPQAAPTAPAEPVHAQMLNPLSRLRVLDAIREAYDKGYNDARNARNARSTPGDAAPGYKGRQVETDNGRELIHALEATAYLSAIQSAAAAPKAEPQPATLSVDMEAEAEALSAKASADFQRMKRDAERYRWLRDEVLQDGEINEDIYVAAEGSRWPNLWALVGDDLDKAVDEMRGIGTAPKGGAS